MGDIQELWNQTNQHSWSALHKTLEEHKGKAQGIEDSLVDMMLQGDTTSGALTRKVS
jgi:hypothetical protein